MKVILYIVSTLMLLLTLLGFYESFGRFLFASGSDVLMTVASSELYIRVVLFIFFIVLIAIYNTTRKHTYGMVSMLVFFLWILSGRMIALFPDERLIGGWFYIESKRINLCSDNMDCEKVYYYDTKYQRESFWRYEISNSQVSISIFTGPFVTNRVDSIFHANFPSGR